MGRILGMALFVIACLLFTLGAFALVQIVQEDMCYDRDHHAETRRQTRERQLVAAGVTPLPPAEHQARLADEEIS